jgi:hypothetical protein
MLISAQSFTSPESFLIELSEKRAQEIMQQFGDDYERIAQALTIMNRRLVLLNPVSKLFHLIFFRNL